MSYIYEPAKNCALLMTDASGKLDDEIYKIKGLIRTFDVDENGNAVSPTQQPMLDWLHDCLKEAESQLEITRQHGKYWLDKYRELENMKQQ